MAKIRIGLNRLRPDNYAFFDPDTRLHLTLDHPQGEVSIVSPGIDRGIKTGVIVDIDKVLDKTGSNQDEELIDPSEDEEPKEDNEPEENDFFDTPVLQEPKKNVRKRTGKKAAAKKEDKEEEI